MSTMCPCCCRPTPGFDELIAEKIARLLDRCASEGIEVTTDEDGEFVHERDAAKLLNMGRQTLRLRRYGARPIPFRKNGAAPEYSLRSIAIEKLEMRGEIGEVLGSDVTSGDAL